MFRNASGHFKIGRYLQIWGGLLNVALAVSLCHFYGLAGIFAAQVLSKLFTSYFPFIMNVQKVVLGFSRKMVMIVWAKRFLLLIGIGTIIWLLCLPIHETTLLNFVFEGVITLVFTVAVLWMVFCKDENFVVVRDMAISKVKMFFKNGC